jgi:hypothetical protein
MTGNIDSLMNYPARLPSWASPGNAAADFAEATT